MTDQDIQRIIRTVDSMFVSAPSLPELYRKMNVLQSHGKGGWRTLCAPKWINGTLVAVLIRPDIDG